MIKTLDLKEAAKFLKMHWQTVRYKTLAGEIPGAKLSKQWVFIEEDLVSYIRSQYANERPRSQEQQHIAGGTQCCLSDQNRSTGGASSPHPTERAYKKALKRK